MGSLDEKYKPTTQKGLFHNSNVTSIKKWLQNLQIESGNYQHILYINGPISCGKTTTLDVLLKGFNIIVLNSDDLRTNDGMNNCLSQCIDFKAVTLENISKINHTHYHKRDKNNLVLIECSEQCDKIIHSFLELLFDEKKLNVPVIIVSNATKIHEVFNKTSRFTNVTFNKPSLLEVSKLVDVVNKVESLGLDKQMKSMLIDFVDYDLRQLFYILSQYALRKQGLDSVDFTEFLKSFDKKLKDIDLYDTLSYMYNPTSPINMEDMFLKASSEPLLLCNSMFYNYLSVNTEFEKVYQQEAFDAIYKVAENCSDANIYNNHIYKNHYWELTPYYAFQGVLYPSVFTKKTFSQKKLPENTNINRVLDTIITPFRDISHNYFNSLTDIKSTTKFDVASYHNDMTISHYISILKTKLIKIDKMYKTKSKSDCNGKGSGENNTVFIQEVYDLTKLIHDMELYNFEESNTDCKTVNDYIAKNIKLINLRPLKKLMNIFVFEKLASFKGSETIICKELLRLLYKKRVPKTININTVEDLVCDLKDIWNFA